jgi:putative chitinase
MTKLAKPAAFFDSIRKGNLLGPALTTDEVKGCEAILKACGNANWPVGWTAYALATAYHETAHTMQPIKELGGTAYFIRMYDIKGNRPTLAKAHGNTTPGDGAKYFGRGYVQLTWKDNYAKAEKLVPIPGLVANPDLALTVDNASKIMIRGMSEGWFTGKSCGTYMSKTGPATTAQFTNARRIINGVDKNTTIAEYANQFQAALLIGGWA